MTSLFDGGGFTSLVVIITLLLAVMSLSSNTCIVVGAEDVVEKIEDDLLAGGGEGYDVTTTTSPSSTSSPSSFSMSMPVMTWHDTYDLINGPPPQPIYVDEPISYILESFDAIDRDASNGWFGIDGDASSASLGGQGAFRLSTNALHGQSSLKVDMTPVTSDAVKDFGWIQPQRPHTSCQDAESISLWLKTVWPDYYLFDTGDATTSNQATAATISVQLITEDAFCDSTILGVDCTTPSTWHTVSLWENSPLPLPVSTGVSDWMELRMNTDWLKVSDPKMNLGRIWGWQAQLSQTDANKTFSVVFDQLECMSSNVMNSMFTTQDSYDWETAVKEGSWIETGRASDGIATLTEDNALEIQFELEGT
jgi:hypothetical protein